MIARAPLRLPLGWARPRRQSPVASLANSALSRPRAAFVLRSSMVAVCLRLANLSRVTSRLLSRSTASRSTRRPIPLLERERSNGGLLPLLFERFGHADETEGDQPIVCGMWKHVSFLCFLFARIFLRAPPFAGLPGH